MLTILVKKQIYNELIIGHVCAKYRYKKGKGYSSHNNIECNNVSSSPAATSQLVDISTLSAIMNV